MSFNEANYQKILDEFERLSDEKYKKFYSGLIPNTTVHYGIKVPEIRRIAKQIIKTDPEGFLQTAKYNSYEETMLIGFVIAGLKTSITHKVSFIKNFLPHIDNWAVCDTFCTSFKLKPQEEETIWQFIEPLFFSQEEFTARFAVVMFLAHFIQEPYFEKGLNKLTQIHHEGYYVKMAIAWAISICFIKYRESTLELLQSQCLSDFVQNKSIQKIRESLRVSKDDKKMLLDYKR